MTAVQKTSGHSAENARFANDGSLESVDLMLHKVAAQCFRRVEAMGLSMTFDDVLQEMRMSYVKAKSSWKPDAGTLFSTYCQAACKFNFNHAIDRMAKERANLGLVSIEGFNKSDDGEADPMESMLNAAGPESDRPDFRIERAGELREQLQSLSPQARLLVAGLLSSTRRGANGVSLREIALVSNIKGAELKRVKLEILGKFGVKW